MSSHSDDRTRPAHEVSALRVSTAGGDGRHVLSLAGELDMDSIAVLQSALSPLWEHATALTFDLGELQFIDSSGLWELCTIHRWCSRRAIAFSLVHATEQVQNVFEVTGLIDILPFRGAT
jgi:anti-anti-sigma factor